ncbi:MAG TPA: hypothetical protein V6C65_04000 [Allocoleopsis sp.]
MTPEELAAKLNGREYLHEIQRHEIDEASQHGLAVAFGCSDDELVVVGAIDADRGAYDGGEYYFYNGRLISDAQIREAREPLEAFGIVIDSKTLPKLEIIWAPEELKEWGASWLIKTSFPSVPFDVMEDGNLFCRGAVFRLEDVK